MSQTAIAERPATEQAAPPIPITEQDELGGIAATNGKQIRPQDVVEYARKHPDGALHRHFTWDDSKAADQYRLRQARDVLAQFWIVSRVEHKPVRMFLSLVSDRHDEGGYRHVDDVLSNKKYRAEWRQMAIRELIQWEKRYAALGELQPVFSSIQRVVQQHVVKSGLA